MGQTDCDQGAGAEYTPEQVAFIRAMEAYQRINHRRFPHFTEVLEVARALGYRLVAEPGPLPRFREPA